MTNPEDRKAWLRSQAASMQVNPDDYRGASTSYDFAATSKSVPALHEQFLEAVRNVDLPEPEDAAPDSLRDVVRRNTLMDVEAAYKNLLQKKADLKNELEVIELTLEQVSNITEKWAAHNPIVAQHFNALKEF